MFEQAVACRRPYGIGWSAWHLPAERCWSAAPRRPRGSGRSFPEGTHADVDRRAARGDCPCACTAVGPARAGRPGGVTLDPPRAIPPTAASLDEPPAPCLGVEEGTAVPETSFADVNLLQSPVSMSRPKRPVGPVRGAVAKPDPALPVPSAHAVRSKRPAGSSR
jgi:hypothetical protein